MTSRVASESLDEGDRPEKKQKAEDDDVRLTFQESYYVTRQAKEMAVVLSFQLNLPATTKLPVSLPVPGTGNGGAVSTLFIESVDYQPNKCAVRLLTTVTLEKVHIVDQTSDINRAIADMTEVSSYRSRCDRTPQMTVLVYTTSSQTRQAATPFQLRTPDHPSTVSFELSDGGVIDLLYAHVRDLPVVRAASQFTEGKDNLIKLTQYDAQTVRVFLAAYIDQLATPPSTIDDINVCHLADLFNQMLVRESSSGFEPSFHPLFYKWQLYMPSIWHKKKEVSLSFKSIVNWYIFGSRLARPLLADFLAKHVLCKYNSIDV
jgi:hypothetical protein